MLVSGALCKRLDAPAVRPCCLAALLLAVLPRPSCAATVRYASLVNRLTPPSLTGLVPRPATGCLCGVWAGPQLTLNKSWTNPSGEWRIGVKRGFELFADKLKLRLTKDAKKEWDKSHHAAEAVAVQAVAQWEKANPGASPSPDAMKEKQELDERVAQLSALKFDFSGPIYDVVVWNDGENWRAAVDGAETGDLSTHAGMTDFHKERQWAKLGPTIQLNYCIAIYQDGAVCNICVDCGEHGTHVAGIIGANRPDAPELNGLAPGCQIVALKIGDARLGSMESLPALVRALAIVVKHKCDLINMSYGEATSVPNQGFFFDMARKVVNKYQAFVPRYFAV